MSREYIAQTLKKLRETTGLKADDVGKLIGKSGKTVNAWENGRGQPDAEMLIKLCGIYKVDNMLAEFDETKSIGSNSSFSQQEISIIKKYRVLDEYGKDMVDTVLEKEYIRYEAAREASRPVIAVSYNKGAVSAGFGDMLADYEEWDKLIVPLTPESRKADFILKVDGDSMEPRFRDGDFILVRRQSAVDIGQIGIFDVNGRGYIKKYGGDKLISLNKAYPDVPVTEDSRCFGMVLGTTEIVGED